jgi:predicted glycogen debranching enzyme
LVFSPWNGGVPLFSTRAPIKRESTIMIDFDRSVCSNIALASQREWLDTNGLGGFASSTLSGMNTRRYHGLLVAALEPPAKRFVLLSKFEETLVLDGARIDLSSNQYLGSIHPQGYQFLHRFEKKFFPIFTYQVGAWQIRKTVFMIQGRNETCIEYEFHGPNEATEQFEVRPLLAYRDYHSLTHENNTLYREYEVSSHGVKFSPYLGLPPLLIVHTAEAFSRDGYWYKDFQYPREQDRRLDSSEDLFSPGYFRAAVHNGARLYFLASAEPSGEATSDKGDVAFEKTKNLELARRESLVKGIPAKEVARFHLHLAANQFLVRRGKASRSVIAGYPWLADWGRDTMISIPGLLLTTQNFAEVREILLTFAHAMRDGLIPNRFADRPEDGENAEYNTADATLWFFHLVHELAVRTEDFDYIKKHFYDMLLDSFEWHRRGTRFYIHMTDDALLSAGTEAVQLTWMDAKVSDWIVTPRHGKAVEICALWSNAIKVLEFFARKFEDRPRAKELQALAQKSQQSFNSIFWNPETRYLNDVVNDQGIDTALRPNQLLAVSLPFAPLEKPHWRSVVDAVTEKLLTPFGIRTLSPTDLHYRGLYQGDQFERDATYHQGTVWPWLLGPYATAFLKAYGHTAKNKQFVRRLLEPLIQYLLNEGTGQLPEVFDGDVRMPEDSSVRPHGKGCFAQAWSVAEIVRVLLEET